MRESFQMREGDMEIKMMLRMLSWRNEGAIYAQQMESTQNTQK